MTRRSDLVATLQERGFVHKATDLEALDAAAVAGTVSAYIGFDLTAPSLHVGSMIQLMALRHVRAHGGAIHVLLGDATTRVGDPSDKDGARPVLTTEAIETNWRGIVRCVDAVLGEVRLHQNSEWLAPLSFMDFLTGPARHTSLNQLVATDVVARRLAAQLPMTLMEAIYQSMQAMDFAELARRHGVNLQIGGSDQWTNIIAGIDLARRTGTAAITGLTTPLMTDAEGRKMGKTAGGRTVWLDPALTSSFDLWQFWRNAPDARVRQFLGLFTELPMDEVGRLGALGGSEINDAKAVLATEAVAIAHGREAAEKAAGAAATLFGSGDGETADMPTATITATQLDAMSFADLAKHTGIVPSKGDARRLAAQGGLRLGGVTLDDANQPIARHVRDGAVLAAGRKRLVRIAIAG